MKRFQSYFIILFTLLLGCVQSAWADVTLYSHPDEYEVYYQAEVKIFVVITAEVNQLTLETDQWASCNSAYLKLSFDLKKESSMYKNMVVYQEIGGAYSEVSTIKYGDMSTDYKSFSIDLNPAATRVKFQSSGENSNKMYLKNIQVVRAQYADVSPSPINCGTIEVNQSSTDTKFDVAWSNVGPLTLSWDNTADFGISTTAIASSLCNYGSENNITIDFHPVTKGDRTTMLTISEGGVVRSTTTITGHADSIPQQLVWWDEEVNMLSRGDTIANPVIATSGLAITSLTSSDESVAKIVDGKLIAVNEGSVDIYAYQAGNSTIGLARDTLHLTVTNLLTQKISWTQPLSFKWGAEATTLTATTSGSTTLTYELVDNANNVVSLSGDVLTISTSNAGTATIRVNAAEENGYAANSMTRTIRVRDPNATCLDEPWVLDYSDEFSLSINSTKDFSWAVADAPLQLSFKAYKTMATAIGDLNIYQKINGSWSEVYTIEVGDLNKNSYKSFSHALNRNATALRFKNSGSYKRYIKDIEVTRAHFCEANASSLSIEGQYNTTTKKTFNLTYSNAQDDIELSIQSGNTEFAVSPSVINVECGDYGTKTITVSYTPSAIESDNDVLIIKSTKDSWNIEIPISTTVSKRSQYIPWEMRDSVATVQPYTLAKTNSVSGLPITYEIDDTTIVRLDSNNKLIFLQVDTAVTIRATCTGNDMYEDATPVEHRIKIFKGLATLTLPTPDGELVYGQTLGELNLIGGSAVDQFGNVIEGDFSWKSREMVPNAGVNVYYPIHFVPYNQSLYDNVNDSIQITVNKHAQVIQWTMPDSIGVMDSLILDAYSSPSGLSITYQLSGEGAAYASVDSNDALNIALNTAALGKELTITAWQVGNNNYLPSDTVTYTVVLRKTRPEFVAITEPTTAGTHLNDVPVYVEHSVDGTWQYEDASNPALDACIYTIKATFTPTRLDLCDPVTVEIPINVNE